MGLSAAFSLSFLSQDYHIDGHIQLRQCLLTFILSLAFDERGMGWDWAWSDLSGQLRGDLYPFFFFFNLRKPNLIS